MSTTITTRQRWTPDRPIVCQADHDEALRLQKTLQEVFGFMIDGEPAKMLVLIKLIDIENALLERELNTI